ncbi:hypothetical protein SCB71_07660 [Herbiconiux sp. KACC 21604]|uniref:hypothetical protein n=1 Tax=unclassified Herbiconiux TaxID=2618217 RepID=UPI001492500A|nr:hypothetical protein [Herbiconiux sp. SALV-R1]QJU53159.1 hypothetical protein HL652_05630 [Herbiconiux sp. SALV-R1]WPO88102.1 hypothetical protein SCB71_07660 [Herbiconiux sp. KACC 21604]
MTTPPRPTTSRPGAAVRRGRVLGVIGFLVMLVATAALGLIGMALDEGQPVDFLTSYVSGLFGVVVVGAVLMLAGIVFLALGLRDARATGGATPVAWTLAVFVVLFVALGTFVVFSLVLP